MTKEIELVVEWLVPAKIIYKAFVDIGDLTRLTRGNVIVEPVSLGKFSLYNDQIQGEFVQLIPDEKIEQKWKLKNWQCFSKVQIYFKDHGTSDSCTMRIVHTEIPDQEDAENIRKGWNSMIIEPIQYFLGYPKQREQNN